ncbi:MAG: helix-turn-helix transcriptional regulator [Planctomycetes bacterium]|nr:helix-turn-helix transcriptional regulator [Planctomycetota bacterium]
MVELMLSGPMSVGDLALAVDLAPAAASQHLNNMRAHGIVDKHRDGRAVFYSVIHPAAESLLLCISRYGDGRQE